MLGKRIIVNQTLSHNRNIRKGFTGVIVGLALSSNNNVKAYEIQFEKPVSGSFQKIYCDDYNWNIWTLFENEFEVQ